MSETSLTVAPASTRQDTIIPILKNTWAQILGVEENQIDVSRPFIEMGAHSLLLLQASRSITERFGVKIPFRAMLEEYPTVTALAAYIEQNAAPEEAAAAEAPRPSDEAAASASPNFVQSAGVSPDGAARELPAHAYATRGAETATPGAEDKTPAVAASSLERLMTQQLQIMGQQIEVLRQMQQGRPAAASEPRRAAPELEIIKPAAPIHKSSNGHAGNGHSGNGHANNGHAGNGHAAAKTSSPDPEAQPVAFYEAVKPTSTDLTPRQQEHVSGLIARVTERTKGSKRVAQEYRHFLADERAISGFRLSWKEMQYPLISERASGARLWDIDGNEYVDVAMGFGALFFGHSPAFLEEAIQDQLKRGLRLGTESLYARKTAELISELTGAERVSFYNSGTEAVMTALRLARTVTGRTKIALFEGCYHGTFDGVLVRTERGEGGRSYAAPMAPGVPDHMIDNVLLLRFNDMGALDILKEHAHELAAVLLEPLPSRMPGVKPKEFLQALRKFTEEAGVALIFDEVVSGFRFHIGGAQALFGVQADIVTYGKAVGGGMPVGVVAGKPAYMDAVDGGAWDFGDRSYPQAETTFCSGTYFKHPFIMPALWAALNHLKDNTPRLHEQLRLNMERLAGTLNSYFEGERVPMRISHFQSLFRFMISPKILNKDLFYYHLLEKGVYVSETRTCYLSTAHTQEDIDFIIEAVKASVEEMRRGELLPTPPPAGAGAEGDGGGAPSTSEAGGAEAADSKKDFRVPLTEAQTYLWLETKMGDDASRAYNEPLVQLITGPFDLDAMRKAVQQLVDRHEALRISFGPEGDYQLIRASLAADVPLVDLSHFDDGERPARLREWVEEEARRVFDLENGPLMRARVVRLAEESHLLSLTISHLITDGWSNGILLGELGALYFNYRAGRACRLPEPMRFSEYVALQAGLQEGAQTAEDESYWLRQLEGPAPSLQLPADRPTPPLRTYNGARQYTYVAAPAYEELKKLAARQGCTLFMLLMAGFNALAHRLSGQDDLVVGIPSAGQSLVGGKPLVGYCVNLVPCRSRVVGDPTFAEYLTSVRRVLLDAYEHQNYPFGKLIKKLNIPRDPSRPTLVTALFNLDKAGRKPSVAGVKLDSMTKPGNSAKFDLSLDITESDEGLSVEWEFNTDLFDAETVRRWSGYFHRLLDAAAADPQRRLSELEMLGDEQRRQLLVEWNDTRREYAGARSVHEMFEEQARRTPDRVAVAFGGEQLTYAELDERAGALASVLRTRGLSAEDRVGVFVERSVEMVVAVLGVLKAGGAYLPLDPAYPPQRLSFMLKDSGAALLLTQERLLQLLPEHSAEVICLDSKGEAANAGGHWGAAARVTPDNLAYVLYTSGSTGVPKGVQVPHGAVVNFINSMRELTAVGQDDVLLAVTTLSFDIAGLELFLPLGAGARLEVASREEAGEGEKLAARMSESGATVMQATPATWRMLLQSGWQGDKALQILCGGEALPQELATELTAAGRRVLNLYGPTETTIWSSAERVGGGPVTIGRPIANTQFYILDGRFEPVPAGVAGDIYIAGEGVARGYWGRGEVTAERFVPDSLGGAAGARMYKTGDRGRYCADGRIKYEGRDDHQVKIRGYRIEPGEVESALVAQGGVAEAAVIAREDEPGKKRLVAYVVGEEGRPAPAASELRARLRERLPDYMVPAAFVALEKMPLTANGKVDRKALPAPEKNGQPGDKTYAEPSTQVEKLLAQIWANTLGVERVGRDDNFFELGGDSILGMQIITKANRAGLQLNPQQIFQHQTVAELAAAAGPAKGIRAEQGEVTGAVALTPIYRWFFEQALPEPHHFNLSNLFEMPQRLDPAAMEKAVGHLLAQHDALRLRVTDESGGPLVIAPAGGDAPFSAEDISALSESDQKAALEAKATELQSSLNLSEGPLLRVALFDLGAGKPSWLLIIVHHLAVDVVSWSILMEDLIAAYRQLKRGVPVTLPLKTTSLKQWAERLGEYAQSPELKREASYWLSEARGRVARLPVDFEGGENTEGAASTVITTLGEEETKSLLHEVPKVSRTQIQETLMAALAQALARWTGGRTLLVDMESHGRESVFEDIDLSRTVGWFTSVVPVLLDLEQPSGAEDALKAVKEQMRSIPNGGIGFGLLRYMSGDAEVAEKMRALAHADVSFNYMGQLGRGLKKTSILGAAQESIGSPRSPRGPRPYLLDVNVTVAEGTLRAHWTYSENVHRRPTIERLAASFNEELSALIARCLSREPVSYKPSDFALAKLDEKKLGRLAKLIDKTGKSAAAKPRALSVSAEELVKVEQPEQGKSTPLVVRAAMAGVDLAGWAADNRALVDESLLKHGAILFRGFGVKTADEFGRFVKAATDDVMEYKERTTPRSEVADRIYTSTDYPAEQSIFPHNESSYAQTFPLKLVFFCATPAESGGETPIGDCRRVLRRIDPDVVKRFEEKKWMYVRNFGGGFGLGWQEVYQTVDRAVVEDYCRRNGIEFEWKDGDGLRTRQVRTAVARHPRTGEPVWFNHAAFFHVSTLDPALAKELLASFAEQDLPNNTFYGDGTPIEPEVLDNIRAAYAEEMIPVGWQKGDVVLLDNILTFHARAPYSGPRKILCSMAEPFARENL